MSERIKVDIFKILAIVVSPNHCHFLCELHENANQIHFDMNIGTARVLSEGLTTALADYDYWKDRHN